MNQPLETGRLNAASDGIGRALPAGAEGENG
jgi:hypothetical protein